MKIGEESIIGALSFIKSGTEIPRRSMVAGNPARIIKNVSDEMLDWKTAGTDLYRRLALECHEHLTETESLTEMPQNRPEQEVLFKTWDEIRKK